MSEYQYVAFRAIDAPVSEKNLEYMRRQSSRAKITSLVVSKRISLWRVPWKRGGNAYRRGYDIHLHYGEFRGSHTDDPVSQRPAGRQGG